MVPDIRGVTGLSLPGFGPVGAVIDLPSSLLPLVDPSAGHIATGDGLRKTREESEGQNMMKLLTRDGMFGTVGGCWYVHCMLLRNL